MLIDARAWKGTVDAEICVIGAGAAGITLARELAAARHDVVLLESGGFAYDESTQKLYEGPIGEGGPQLEPTYLEASRLRYFGGTTNHWEGWCRTLEEIDMQPRQWVAMSGWPITRASLEPYYVRACAHLGIQSLTDDPADSRAGRLLFAPESSLETKVFRQSPPQRFGQSFRQELIASAHVRLFLWANAIELVSNESASAVERIRVATLSGNEFGVRARFYVLAAGGIECARLLLASNAVQPDGLGNGSDMVGRCFMEHPRIEEIGSVVVLRNTTALGTYAMRKIDAEHHAWGGLAPSPILQRERKLLNGCFALIPGEAAELGSDVAEVAAAVEQSKSSPEVPVHAQIDIVCEQAPNRESRVTLSEEKDAFARPRARLDWRLSELDHHSARASLELLACELGRSGLGRSAFFIDESAPWRHVITSGHHIGTTRMSVDAKDGVVDATLRVHGIHNLYVASSSTFPTSGLASPTPTIVALAVRLADHLNERFA